MIYILKAVWTYLLVTILVPDLPLGTNDAASREAVGDDRITWHRITRCLSLLFWLCFFFFLVHSWNSWIVLFSDVHLFFPPFPPWIHSLSSLFQLLYSAIVQWSFGSSLYILFLFWDLLFLWWDFVYFYLFSNIFIIVPWNRLRMAALKSLSDNCIIGVITTLSSVDYFFQSLWDFSRSWYFKWFPKTWTLGLLCYAELT